jgi:hypothetical protein
MKVLVKRKLKEILEKTSEPMQLQLKVKMKLESRLHNQKQHVASVKQKLRTALASEKYKVQKH